jgi:hypothetical protein
MLAKAPHCLLAPLFRILLAQDRKHHPSGDLPLEAIIPTMRHDVQLAKTPKALFSRSAPLMRMCCSWEGASRLPIYDSPSTNWKRFCRTRGALHFVA